MKRIILTVGSLVVFAGCSNSELQNENSISENEESSVTNSEEQKNLINSVNIEDGKWIGQSSKESNSEDMVLTDPIAYDPSKIYMINKTAYVSYLNDNEVIKTVLYSEEQPEIELDTVEQANNIRISMKDYKLETFKLFEN